MLIDPRQSATLAGYKDPKSETFANLYRSALKAGYDDKYASNLSAMRPTWLMDNIVADVKAVVTAENNLRELNEYKLPPSKIKTKRDVELGKMKVDVSKFILKTQARSKYSEDKELATPNVQINIVNYNEKPQNAQGEAQTSPLDVPYTEVKE
jgi:hypothetical protein